MMERNKRKRRSSSSTSSTSTGTSLHLFPLLLASASRYGINPCAAPLLRRLLRRALSLSQLSRMNETNEQVLSLLPLFPLLLSSSSSHSHSSPRIVSLTAQLIGATSLQAALHNRTIASDAALLKALLRTLTCKSKPISVSILTALLDLSVSSFTRDRLRDAAALPKLLYMLCQEMAPHSHTHTIPTNQFFASLLDLTLLLINTSSIHFYHHISHHLIQKVLPFFSKLQRTSSTYSKTGNLNLRRRNHQLSQTIFRLSLGLPNPTPNPTFTSEELRSYVFGPKQSDFQHFLLHFWENSPILIKKGSHNFDKTDTIFLALLHYVNPISADSIIHSILQYSVTCPAIVSDELDINQFLNEMETSLGSPLIYNQDIRIVKTEGQTPNKEEHFPHNDRCQEAFNNGYSIALKGMEFRSDLVASFSLAFAELFGLPSIGVNLYLSPPGAQGLARHFDDHCVLVWQITGCKSWRILKQPKPVMPRLYESLDNTFASEKAGEIEIVLEEGDILYVPRGYFHEARTGTNASGPHESDCSLHLTFAIEVERPFEWEGFVHVALHCWRKKLNQTSHNLLLNSNSKFQIITHALLLHVAIKLISDQTPAFWKACMVASNFKIDEQKSTFDRLINIINEQSNFMEAFSWVKFAVGQREEDSILCMRWLRNVDDDIDFDNLLETLEKYVVAAYTGKTEEAMAEFSLFKSRFCEGAIYEDARVSFCSLLEKYRKARRQYMKGMLSLHRKY